MGKRFKKFRKTKKGIAPLIATVLLIAFAVALGAIVMNWGRAYVEDTAALAQKSSSGQVECTNDVDLEIKKILYPADDSDTDMIDDYINNDDDTLKVVVENLKSKKVRGLAIKLISEDGSGFVTPIVEDLDDMKEDSNTTLDPFEIKTIVIEDLYDDDLDFSNSLSEVGEINLKEISIIPYILPDEDFDLDIIACDGRVKTSKYGEEAWPDEKILFGPDV